MLVSRKARSAELLMLVRTLDFRRCPRPPGRRHPPPNSNKRANPILWRRTSDMLGLTVTRYKNGWIDLHQREKPTQLIGRRIVNYRTRHGWYYPAMAHNIIMRRIVVGKRLDMEGHTQQWRALWGHR